MIVTFYSYKGGVGRSMALVNVAQILADEGRRVLIIDWDLEAPGLERYLLRPDVDTESQLAELWSLPGLMDLIMSYKAAMLQPADESVGHDPRTMARVGNLLLQRPSALAKEIPPIGNGYAGRRPFYFMSAGRRDGSHLNDYIEGVRTFDWEDFYARWGGAGYIDFLRRDLLAEADGNVPYDIVLIDSRTGFTEHGGICTHLLADIVVLMMAANMANLYGSEMMNTSLTGDRVREARGDRQLEILPVRSRIEWTAQRDELNAFRRQFDKTFRQDKQESLKVEIPYMPYYSFSERVVARETLTDQEPRLYAAYKGLAEAIILRGTKMSLLRGQAPRSHRMAKTPRLDVGPVAVIGPSGDQTAIIQGLSSVNVSAFPVATVGLKKPKRHLVVLDDRQPFAPTDQAYVYEALRGQALSPDTRLLALERSSQASAKLGWQTPVIRLTDKPDSQFFDRLADLIEAPEGSRVVIDDAAKPAFRGFDSFDESDAPFFYGRDEELTVLFDDAMTRARGLTHWLDVIGASGYGRTSFIFAALIPAIRRGEFVAIPATTTMLHMQSGRDLLKALANALRPITDRPLDDLRGQLTASPLALSNLLQQSESASKSWLLVVDDMEEFYAPGAMGTADVERLLETALQKNPNLWLLTASRGDTIPIRIRRFDPVYTPMASVELREISAEALKNALEATARIRGLTWESGLLERIVAEYRTARQTPAFVSQALLKTHQQSNGRTLTHAAYESSGGIGRAAVARAQETFEQLDTDEASRACRLLPHFVTSSGVPTDMETSAALKLMGGDPAAAMLLERLAARRVVTVDTRVRLAHPALATEWPLFASWVERERDHLQRRDAVNALATVWEQTRRRLVHRALHSQTRHFKDLVDVTPLAADYIRTASTWWKRWKIAGLSVAATILIGIGLFLALEVSDRSAREKRITSIVERAGHEKDAYKRLGMALSASEAEPDHPAPLALLRSVLRAQRKIRTIAIDALPKRLRVEHSDVTVVPDGIRPVMIIDATNGSITNVTDPLPDDLVVAANSHGRRVISGDNNGYVRIWDLRKNLLAYLRVSSRPIVAVDIDRRGQRFAAAASDGSLVIGYADEDVQPARTRLAHERPHQLFFTPDGRTIIVVTATGHLAEWKYPFNSPPVQHLVPSGQTALAVGNRAAVTVGRQGLTIWSLRPELHSTEAPVPHGAPWKDPSDNSIADGQSSYDSVLILISANDDLAHLWSTSSAEQERVRTHTGEPVSHCGFLPRQRLVVGGSDGSITVYRYTMDPLALKELIREPRGHEGQIIYAAATADGNTLVTVGDDRKVSLWDISDIPEDDPALIELARRRLRAATPNG